MAVKSMSKPKKQQSSKKPNSNPTTSRTKDREQSEFAGWTESEVQSILGNVLKASSLKQNHKFACQGLTADSRSCKKGDLFVALRGPNHHGIEFLSQALKSGVSAVVSDVPAPPDVNCNVPIFLVEDSQLAFRRLVAAWRERFEIPLIAVAGSVGKTTTKDMLAAILSGRFKRVLKTEMSQNGFLGIPVTLANLSPENGAAVIEIGIDDVGAMAQHFDLVKPTIAIVTAIAPEHLDRLRDLETVAAEETLLLKRTVASGGSAVVNLDDEYCRLVGVGLKAEHRVCHSLNAKTKIKPDILVGRLSSDGQTVEVHGQVRGIEFNKEKFQLPLLGKHNAANLLGAISAAALAGLEPSEIKAGLKHFKPEQGRSRIEQLDNGTVVICDYYNASPASVSAALDLLKDRSIVTGMRGKKYACLGDMLELGSDEELLHRRIADKLAATGVDKVLLFGDRMKWLADELRRRKFESDVAHFESHDSLVEHLLERLRPDDHVLIKGSRGMAMEQVWFALQSQSQ